ncbi:hypothetical protein [Yinghuangia aomiensis]|uniref:hypothetical protein n=1 Tax=Yinghuangia aomiensis TaxID=676205 RepID=UPI0031F09689
MPTAFDQARGWQSDQRQRVFTVAPMAGVFIDLSAQENPTEGASPLAGPPSSDASADPATQLPAVIARKADDGTVLWSSKPLGPLSAQRTPELHVISTEGGEYVVVVRRGVVPPAGIARSRDLLVVDSFPVSAEGRDVAPTAHLEREVTGGLDNAVAAVGDGGVLFPGTADGNGTAQEGALWDPFTGAVSPVAVGAPVTRSCSTKRSGCTVQDVPVLPTAAGVLTTEQPASDELRFGIPGRWTSASIAPHGANRGRVIQVVGGTVLIGWYHDNDGSTVYALHDLTTGDLLVSAACDIGVASNSGSPPELTALSSPEGRYVAVGSLLFDLSARTAQCYSGDKTTRGVLFAALTDSGTAYGTLRDDQDDTPDPVTVNTSTKAIDRLPEGTQLPDFVTRGGVGLFTVVGDQHNGTAVSTAFLLPPAVPGAPLPATPASPSPVAAR